MSAAATDSPAAPAAAAPAAAAAAPAAGAPAYQSTSLYVGDLHPDVSEGMLFEIFNGVGPVHSIRVNRDAVTRRSLGYAYVNFINPADAELALDTMNNFVIKDRPCRIMWSQRDPSIRKSGVGNIFIKNLDPTIDHKALYDVFSDFGSILSCKVALDDQGRSKGYGFVHYETQETADRAIEKINGKLIGDSETKVFVGPFIAKKELLANRFAQFTNVYVKNIPVEASNDLVRQLCQQYGEVTSAMVMLDADGKSRGFGFVNFATHEGAAAAVEALHGKPFDFNGVVHPEGKPLFVCRAQKKNERQAELRHKYAKLQQERVLKYQGVNLYVKNIDDEFGDDWLKQEFGSFGNITSARVMRDEKGNSKGFGFVCFSTPEEATKAVTEMHGKVYGTKPIYVALAQPKHLRRAHLEAQYAQRLKTGRGGFPPQQPSMHMYAPGGAPVYYPGGAPGGVGPQGQFMYGPPQQMGMLPGGRRGAPAWHGAPAPFPPMHQVPPYGAAPAQPRGGAAAGRGPAAGGVVAPHPGAAAAGRGYQRGPGPMMPMPVSEVEPITVEFLQKMSPEDQFLCASQRLYPIIMKQQPSLAPKITGMIRSWYLESHQGPEQLVTLLNNPEALNEKIHEALEVWQQHVQSLSKDGQPPVKE